MMLLPLAPLPTSAAVLLCAAAPLLAAHQDDLPPNHPSNDPYTLGDPELMRAAGITSMGGFEFGRTDTVEIDAYLAQADIRWIETEHFELGFALGPSKPSRDEQVRLEQELATLRLALPEVPEKARRLDPWLRAHLYGLRLEAMYARMQEILQVTDADFPRKALDIYPLGQKYMGMGPYLGQKSKYEVLILPNEELGMAYMQRHNGLSVRESQRWNILDRGALTLTVIADDHLSKNDLALHAHVAFSMGVNLLDGYKLYTYELPVWLREGFAHLLEREISPEHNTFDADEGSSGEETRKSDWLKEVRGLVRDGEAPGLGRLSRLKSYGEMSLDDHFTAWSKVQFLVVAHPDATAALLDRLCGLVDSEGRPDGAGIADQQRDALRELLGMTYAQFDEAWATWIESEQAEAAQVPLAEREGPEPDR
jgi:hypothetical protein